MSQRWLGVTVVSGRVTVVDAEISDSGQVIIRADLTWDLQQGDRSAAYAVMHGRVADYIRQNNISCAVIKASAVSLGGTRKAHLEAAELRGVVMSALASATAVRTETKAKISRNFGERGADEYLADAAFWAAETSGPLRVGSREAALLVLAAMK